MTKFLSETGCVTKHYEVMSYIGGKSKIAKQLTIPNIPTDIEVYVECFSGMMWTFFKMNLSDYPNLKTVVYNDINPLNVNLFNCLRNYNKFYSIIKDVESENRELFYQYQQELFQPDFKINLNRPDYTTACKYAYILTHCWSGSNPSKGGYVNQGRTPKFESFKNKLIHPKWQQYFDRITVTHNLDYQSVIRRYDGLKTYFYCDPPYYNFEHYYSNNVAQFDHNRLADCLKSIQGMFSLSYYEFDELYEWFPVDEFEWKEKEFTKSSAATSGSTLNKGTEILIMNYSTTDTIFSNYKKSTIMKSSFIVKPQVTELPTDVKAFRNGTYTLSEGKHKITVFGRKITSVDDVKGATLVDGEYSFTNGKIGVVSGSFIYHKEVVVETTATSKKKEKVDVIELLGTLIEQNLEIISLLQHPKRKAS
ncbi:MAG: DNA adenine methylase [Chitinophagaceae bacterium]|nr:MAG: DNA adenine methylase [Chitinophagaceae bacterium]